VTALRTILAGALLLAPALGLLAYGVSCSSPQSRETVPPISKFVPGLPKPATPEPPKTPKATDTTVGEVIEAGCSTEVVRALSEQIIAEGNCIEPGAFEKLPELENVELDDSVFPYLRRNARDALVSALRSTKRHRIKINSMLRTVAQQYLLFQWYERGRCGIKLAANPGRSNHQSGLAIDVSEPNRWRSTLTRNGFRWLGKKDRWHFDYVGKKSRRGRAAEPTEGLDVHAFQRLWNRNHPDDPIAENGEFDDATREALQEAPVAGFKQGAMCDQEEMEDLDDAAHP
jgi:hypothetical protein